MGFLSKSLYEIYDYEIDIEKIIFPVYYLIIEMSSQKGSAEDFSIWGSKIFKAGKIYGQDSIPESEDESLFLGKIVKYLTEDLYEDPSFLRESGIVFIHNKRKILICHQSVGRKPVEVLKNWLKNYSPVKKLFSFVTEDGLLALEDKFSGLISEMHYGKAVSAKLRNKWDSYIIPKSWLVYDNIKRELLDNASIWINDRHFSHIPDTKNLEIRELYIQERLVGLEVGEYILPLISVDSLIADASFSDYFFLMLQNVFSPDKKGEISREGESEFKEKFKDSKLSKLLSYLNFNLYITKGDVKIGKDYKQFFEEVVGLEQIENLEGYQLYVSTKSLDNKKDEEKGKYNTVVGIYEKEKHKSEYNILNWITSSSDKGIYSHIGNKENKQQTKSVYVLRPPYCNYFSSRLYEDVFTDILQGLGCSYVTNTELSFANGVQTEEDSIAKKNDGTFVYIENKTTLNRYNLEETIQEIETFHSFVSKEYPSLKFQYLITAPYSNMNLDDGYRYFINTSVKGKKGKKGKKGRKGVNCNLYDFEVPIAKFNNVSLRCIVEPEYAKMKAIISEIVK